MTFGTLRELAADALSFGHWCKAEALSMAPPLRKLFGSRTILAIDPDTATVREYRTHDGMELPRSDTIEGAPECWPESITTLVSNPQGTDLALHQKGAVCTTVRYAYGARHDLASLIALDIDRLSPYGRHSAKCTYSVTHTDKTSDTVTVSLCIAQKNEIAAAIANAKKAGLSLAYTGPSPHPPWHHNLVADGTGHIGQRRIALFLWIMTVCLALAVTATPIIKGQHEANLLRQRLLDLEHQTRAVAAERNKREQALIREADFLNQRRGLVPILALISKTLPPEGRLTRLAFHDAKLDIAGVAPRTRVLVDALLENALVGKVDYAAPVTVSGEDKLETFRLMIHTMDGDSS